MADLSSQCYIRPGQPGGMIRKYSPHTRGWGQAGLCNNIQVGRCMRSILLTDGMRHIVT